MASAAGWILTAGGLAGVAIFSIRGQWLAAGFHLALAAVASTMLAMGVGSGGFDLLLNALTLLCFPWAPGVYLLTPSGQRFAEANHLSAGGAKAFGGFLVLLGLVGAVGLVLSALGI